MPVLAAMLLPETYPHPVSTITVQDTHISRVFLTGRWAYKIKKAVDFGFLDFSTPARRLFFCRREVELNRRLTHGVYAEVVAVCRQNEGYRIDGAGVPVEYAVRMRQLSDRDTLSARLQRGAIAAPQIVQLVKYLLAFYAARTRVSATAKTDIWLGVRTACRENIRQAAAAPASLRDRARLDRIHRATEQYLETNQALFLNRVEHGHVRACHGDLRGDHVYFGRDGSIQIIDCIEFNDNLRRIDIISDLAFLTMDLDHKGFPHHANLVMQAYAQGREDADGLALWPFYQCYRAMVRCKVNAINGQQAVPQDDRQTIYRQNARRYLRLAASYAARLEKPVVFALCGLPATGKSTLARGLSQALAAPAYRSDVERRRRFSQSHRGGRDNAVPAARYTPAATRQVYDCLLERAGKELRHKRSVILDATFGRPAMRQALRRLAYAQQADVLFIYCRAPLASIKVRLGARALQPGVSEARWADLPAIAHRFRRPAPGRDVLEIRTDRAITPCLAEILHFVARRPQRHRTDCGSAALHTAKGGHHVQNHSGRHRPGDPARHARNGRPGAQPPVPVRPANPPCA
jgi:aminoglycoside phosphotransferase family enzyme/predicted kinase